MKLLIVEDDLCLREALVDTLSMKGFDCIEADNGKTAVTLLDKADFVVSDVNMPGMDGHELLAYTKKYFPDLPIVLATAYGNVSRAVEAIQLGALDYIVKPFSPDQLITIINNLVDEDISYKDDPIAQDPSSIQVLSMAKKVADTDSTILISGESGTGKEVLARYIHKHSPRSEKPFIAINCAAIPENMLEATLFGHEKGAFTGAYQSAPGKFEQANGGTILLDEISEMELGLQAKLLRVLQEREVERIGGRKLIKLDVRVIATTNRDLRKEVQDKTFREDLYYRLSVFPIQWRPLRFRSGDILPMAEFLLKKHCKKMHKSFVHFNEEAKKRLMQYTWPGNIREMENVVQRALILQNGQEVGAFDLHLQEEFQQGDGYVNSTIDSAFNDKPELAELTDKNTQDPEQGFLDDISKNGTNEDSLAEVNQELGVDLKHKEFELILNALSSEKGSKGKAAIRLGISARTLRYKLAKMRDLGIDVDGRIAAL